MYSYNASRHIKQLIIFTAFRLLNKKFWAELIMSTFYQTFPPLKWVLCQNDPAGYHPKTHYYTYDFAHNNLFIYLYIASNDKMTVK
jgi:hypothetical protein